LFFDGESCKRLIQPSCRGRTGQVPVTILNTMKAMRGQLGSVVVIMSGYDDSRVDDAVEAITAEALSQGVKRVLWLTYVEDVSYVGPGGITFAATFRSHNQTLRDKLLDHPELDLADWNTFSKGHPDWFGVDGIHLAQPTGPHLVQFLAVDRRAVHGDGRLRDRTRRARGNRARARADASRLRTRHTDAHSRHAHGRRSRCAPSAREGRRAARRCYRGRREPHRHRGSVHRRLPHCRAVWHRGSRRVEPERHSKTNRGEPGHRRPG
jgi:hypothetical protein